MYVHGTKNNNVYYVRTYVHGSKNITLCMYTYACTYIHGTYMVEK